MFQKLNKVGVTGNVLKIIKHIYSTTEFCIRKDNFISNPIANNKGVKQGDSLSPTLFNGSKNDPVLLGDSRLNHLLFADDLLLLSETSNGLQNCKKSPRTSSIMQTIFLFRSFEISKDIQSVQNTHV